MTDQESRVYTLPGKPEALERPRFVQSRDYSINVYDAQKNSKLCKYLNIKSQHYGLPFIDYPVHMDVVFTFKVPNSYSSHKKRLCLDKPYTSRPDVDNLVKMVLDVCNKVIYNDDAIVTSISAKKVYGHESMTVFTFSRI